MKFFFPHGIGNRCQRNFDWENEEGDGDLVCAHDLLDEHTYDGLLMSRAEVSSNRLADIVDAGGVRAFYNSPLPTMGDCGAFTWRNEDMPQVTVPELVEFYQKCDFDIAASLDHIITGFHKFCGGIGPPPAEAQRRWELTMHLAEEFMAESAGQRYIPMGVAQGWCPDVYADSVEGLQKIGYNYIAVGGIPMVSSEGIVSILEAIARVRKPDTRLHLFGVGRLKYLDTFTSLGAFSFDTTSPFLGAFSMGPLYFTYHKKYAGIRLPRLESSRNLAAYIEETGTSYEEIEAAETAALEAALAFEEDPNASVPDTLDKLMAYCEYAAAASSSQWNMDSEREGLRETLTDRPWEKCGCVLCEDAGIRIMFLRGTGSTNEYSWRRGYHNLLVFRRWIDEGVPEPSADDVPAWGGSLATLLAGVDG